MGDFSLYQWLVLGLLFIIALATMALAFGLERTLEALTRRIEGALEDIRSELQRPGRPDYDDF